MSSPARVLSAALPAQPCMPPRKPEVDPTSWAGDLCTFRFAGARPAAQLAAAANMGAAQLFSARDSANDFTCNVAGTDGLCNSVARGSSSISRFDPVTPTAALRDAPTDGWVRWSAFSADHRLHAAILHPVLPTEAMESAGSMLKGWDLTDLGEPGNTPLLPHAKSLSFTRHARLRDSRTKAATAVPGSAHRPERDAEYRHVREVEQDLKNPDIFVLTKK